MPVREPRRPPAFSPIIIHEYASSETSASPRVSGDSMQGPDLACDPDQLDYPARISDAALSSPDDSMQGPVLVCDLEQLEDPARPSRSIQKGSH